ncbi:hypothetical protein AGMMS4952_11120 [Spirochaetia bacterium]|nr:hypothetical protein AGMMS4952_11120 [Spirochaetia bacterium]
MEKAKEEKKGEGKKDRKKFNSERIARQVKKALGEVYPKKQFFVSEFVDSVEVLYLGGNGLTSMEMNTFKAVFCTLSKTDSAKIIFSAVKKEADAPATAPAPAGAPAK